LNELLNEFSANAAPTLIWINDEFGYGTFNLIGDVEVRIADEVACTVRPHEEVLCPVVSAVANMETYVFVERTNSVVFGNTRHQLFNGVNLLGA
jgi:hypothetical protein